MRKLRDGRIRPRLARELEEHPRRTLHDAVFTYMKNNKALEGMSLPGRGGSALEPASARR